MIRDKIITVLSNTLSIDGQYIEEETNLIFLCILSEYLKVPFIKNDNPLIISKDGLRNITPLHIKHENQQSYFEINFLFENRGNESVKYFDEIGADSFYNFNFVLMNLAFTIEDELGVQINDDQWDAMKNVGDIISAVSEVIQKQNEIKQLTKEPVLTQLTKSIINSIKPEDIIYAEFASAGAMGNAGGVMIYTIQNNTLLRCQTSLSTNEEIYKQATELLLEHQDQIKRKDIILKETLLNYFYGGMGNHVFVSKNVLLNNRDGYFICEIEKYEYKISASVQGVFNSVVRNLK